MNMTVVRISNLPGQVTANDMSELISLVDEPLNLKLTFADDGTRVCEVRSTLVSDELVMSSQYVAHVACKSAVEIPGMAHRTIRVHFEDLTSIM